VNVQVDESREQGRAFDVDDPPGHHLDGFEVDRFDAVASHDERARASVAPVEELPVNEDETVLAASLVDSYVGRIGLSLGPSRVGDVVRGARRSGGVVRAARGENPSGEDGDSGSKGGEASGHAKPGQQESCRQINAKFRKADHLVLAV
jgi:hypothetical protein